MLYAVSGSQGSGKSFTLDHLPYRKIVRKTSRSILADWNVTLSQVNNDRELTVRFQEEILKRKYDDECADVNTDEIVFTERTPMDLFVYALVALGKDNEYSDWLNDYYTRCLNMSMDMYAGVFYLFPLKGMAIENDGVRATNHHYSHLINSTLLWYTGKLTTTHLVATSDLGDRIELIQRALNNHQ